MLLGVEVVQRALEIERTRPIPTSGERPLSTNAHSVCAVCAVCALRAVRAVIPGEEEDEGRVPHEETVVERSVDEVGHEAVLRPRRLDVTKGLVVQE